MVDIRITPGAGETCDFRLWNDTDGETILEITGVTTDSALSSGWVDYDPSDFTGNKLIVAQGRTNPGANSSSFKAITVYFGVKI